MLPRDWDRGGGLEVRGGGEGSAWGREKGEVEKDVRRHLKKGRGSKDGTSGRGGGGTWEREEVERVKCGGSENKKLLVLLPVFISIWGKRSERSTATTYKIKRRGASLKLHFSWRAGSTSGSTYKQDD